MFSDSSHGRYKWYTYSIRMIVYLDNPYENRLNAIIASSSVFHCK